MDQLLSHATVSGKAATVSYQMVLHRPVELAAVVRKVDLSTQMSSNATNLELVFGCLAPRKPALQTLVDSELKID